MSTKLTQELSSKIPRLKKLSTKGIGYVGQKLVGTAVVEVHATLTLLSMEQAFLCTFSL